MNRKVKASVLLSVIWVFGWFLVLVNEEFFYNGKYRAGHRIDFQGWTEWTLLAYTPLILGWGLYWVLKKD